MIKYCIKKENLYYIGHCGHFDKDIKNARFYNTPKMAIKNVYVPENINYEDLKIVKVNIEELEEHWINSEHYQMYGNYDYENRHKKE